MAVKPYKSAILNGIHALTRPRPRAVKYAPQAPFTRWEPNTRTRQPQLYVNRELQDGAATKAISYSQYVQDFINDQGAYSPLYSEQQVEMAYRTSVYLFSALRYVANLMSEIQIVGEKHHNGKWVRLPETHHLNKMFEHAGAEFLWQSYIYAAMYGDLLVYKEKTRPAIYAYHRGKPIYNYLEGAIAGFHIIPKSKWEMIEDTYNDTILEFLLNEPDEEVGKDRRALDRQEVVYWNDFDPRYENQGVSMVSLAINNAVTNAAIARWASHYFMSGAMPLLLVNTEDDPASIDEVDLQRYKNFIERAWQGLWGQFTLRAKFTDRKLNVQQVGIDAEKVTAPELNRDALNAIASVFQIAPDLIVPPEGGSDNARHKYLIMQAYSVAVLPVAKRLVTAFNRDFGFEGTPYRLVVAEDKIRALEADRGDLADTELKIFGGGIQTFAETQERLRARPIPELANFVQVNGTLKSVERILRDDKMASSELLQYAGTAWNDNALTLGEYRQIMFGIQTPADKAGKFKFEFVPETGSDGSFKQPELPSGPDGGTPPTDTPPTLPPGGDAPTTPSAPEIRHRVESEPATDGDKADATSGMTLQTLGDLKLEGQSQHPQPAPNGSAPVSDTLIPTGTHTEVLLSNNPDPSENILFPGGGLPVLTQTGVGTFEVESPTVTEEPAPPTPAYVSLALANDDLIHVVRNDLVKVLGDAAARVEWSDPATWHCTLVYAADATDDALTNIRKFLPSHCPQMGLRVTGVNVWETPDGVCISLAVEADSALDALQAKARVAFQAFQLELSEYSLAGQYNPHITLGYAPAEFAVPEFAYSVIVHPQALTIGREGFEQFIVIPPFTPDPTLLDIDLASTTEDSNTLAGRERLLVDTDMRRARLRTVLTEWHAKSDEDVTVPPTVLACVKEALAYSPDRDAVFACARDCIDAGHFDDDSVPVENPIIRLLERQKAVQDTAEDELRAWQKVALRNRQKAFERFETQRLPLDIEQTVRAALKTASDRDAVRAIFSDAFAALAESTRVGESDEDALAAWAERLQDDDELKSLLGDESELT